MPFPDRRRRIVQPSSAIAYVSASSGQATAPGFDPGPFSLTGLSAIPTGAAICVSWCAAISQTYSFPTVTVTAGTNTATAVSGLYQAGGTFIMETYYFLNVTGGPTSVTFTRVGGTQTFNFVSMQVDTFTGVATSAALDGHNLYVQGTTSGLTAGSADTSSIASAPGTGTDAVTTGAGYSQSTSGDLMWATTVDATGAGGITHGTNFTQAQYQSSTNMTEYNLNQASGTVIGTFTTTDGTAIFITAAMSLKASAGVVTPDAFGTSIFRMQQPLWR